MSTSKLQPAIRGSGTTAALFDHAPGLTLAALQDLDKDGVGTIKTTWGRTNASIMLKTKREDILLSGSQTIILEGRTVEKAQPLALRLTPPQRGGGYV